MAMIIVLVRHAEREAAGTDPHLTAVGRQRAALLARMLKDAGVTAIFTSTARRTKETAAPLAAMLHLGPTVINDDPAEAKGQLLASGERVLVVGHTNTVPALIAELGGPADVEIDDSEFDHFFVLTVTNGHATLLAMRYGQT